MMIARTACALLVASFCLRAGAAVGADVATILQRPAMKVAAPARQVMLDVTEAGQRVVAVGEHGIIVLSDDAGATWRQAAVPVSVTLTAVMFASAKRGWAVGHSGVVLRSDDGGESWVRQLDGVQVAALASRDAQVRGGRAYLNFARQLIADGPDKPFLAVHFFDARRGLVVGAYGLIFETENGGASWQPAMSRIDNSKWLHLYAIATHANTVDIAGEQGLFERSTDGGKTFRRVPTRYGGTYFALAAARSGATAVGGLRGSAFLVNGEDSTFRRVTSPASVSFTTIATLKDGCLLFANQAGQIWALAPSRDRLELVALPPMPAVSGLVQTADGALIVAGLGGVMRFSLPNLAPVSERTPRQ